MSLTARQEAFAAGVAQGLSQAEAYRRWQTMGAEPGTAWAHAIVADYREGVALPLYVVRLAFEALGLEPEPQVLRKPRWPVPRPDSRERQAGDVEVEF